MTTQRFLLKGGKVLGADTADLLISNGELRQCLHRLQMKAQLL